MVNVKGTAYYIMNGISITITNCIFMSSGLTEALLALPNNEEYEGDVTGILINEEKITEPSSKEDLIRCLEGRSGDVRIGFCTGCGIPAAYEEDMVTWRHPDTSEDIINCILNS